MRAENKNNGTLNAYVIRPDEIRENDQYGYKVMAVVHPGKRFWSAYRGLTLQDDAEVVAFGDKISKPAAEALFPTLAKNLIYSE